MLNYQLDILGDESLTSINHYDEFYVNILFDSSFYGTISPEYFFIYNIPLLKRTLGRQYSIINQ